MISAHATILPGVHIGKHALVAAHACVSKDIPEKTAVKGVPAKYFCKTEAIKTRNSPEKSPYPWPSHFTRGYPEDAVAELKEHDTKDTD